ncbi:hypothetical protein LM596_05165 [Liquorilactobacillus mali]|nr:hypothetical protein LM596_05165 [Liquorilactobacillus mali]
MAAIIIILMFILWKMFKFSFNVILPLLFLTLIILWIAEAIKILFPLIIVAVGGYLVYRTRNSSL